MTETGDYQPPEAAEQRSFPQEDLNAIRQRIGEIQSEQNERGGLYPSEYFYLTTKRRIIDHSLNVSGRPTAENIEDNLTITLRETRYGKNEKAYRDVDALRWAFLTYALPHDKGLSQSWITTYELAEQFNAMQREQMQQAGQTIDAVTLDPEQSQTLRWMLDQVAIPHTLSETENHVSLAPAEQKLREAAVTNAAKYTNDPSRKDHETRENISTLMDQWKQQDNQES